MKVIQFICDICSETTVNSEHDFEKLFTKEGVLCKDGHSIDGSIVAHDKKFSVKTQIKCEDPEAQHICKKCFKNLLESVIGEEILNKVFPK